MKISLKYFILINLWLMLMFPDVIIHLIATFPGFFSQRGSHYSVTTLTICQALIMPYNWQLDQIKTINLVNHLPRTLALWNSSLMHYQVSPIPFTNVLLYKLCKVTV